MALTQLLRCSATQLAQKIRSAEVSATEVVTAHLQRIAEVNPRVNAVTVVMEEAALAAAKRIDDGARDGPLCGVPFTVKENIDCQGTATTQGSPSLEFALPYSDAPVVERLRAAGAIPIARTNLSELGFRVCTANPLRGQTLNPYDPKLTPGGSSGGDAVALATGMTALGLGNDLGGSLRNPAYCCGIAALKPTIGRIPHSSSLPPHDSGMAGQAMLGQGPMARTVADLRVSLSVLAGRDYRDPRTVDAPLQGPEPELRRAGLITQFRGLQLPDGTHEALRRAGQILAHAGWEVEEVVPPELDRVCEIWGRLLVVDLLAQLPRLERALSKTLAEHLHAMCGRYDVNQMSNHMIHTERSRLRRLWSGFLQEYPVLVGPTWTCLPWPLEADLHPTRGLDMIADATRFVLPANVLGLPALAMPMACADGSEASLSGAGTLPAGVQIYADLWREDLCLEVAELIEASAPHVTPMDPGF